MKTFKNYLTESVKEYNFCVKLAGLDEAPDMDHFETMFEKYGLKSMSNFKQTPIQEHPMDFYNITNSDVYISEVSFDYPVTSNELYHYIQEQSGLTGKQVVVINSSHPEEISREEKISKGEEPYVPLLDSEYEQDAYEIEYGDAYNGNMLKELETRQYEFDAGKTPAAKTTNDDPINTKAVMSDRGEYNSGKK